MVALPTDSGSDDFFEESSDYSSNYTFLGKVAVVITKKNVANPALPLPVKINYLEKMSSGQKDASMKTGA